MHLNRLVKAKIIYLYLEWDRENIYLNFMKFYGILKNCMKIPRNDLIN